jgi:hypothetical protein
MLDSKSVQTVLISGIEQSAHAWMNGCTGTTEGVSRHPGTDKEAFKVTVEDEDHKEKSLWIPRKYLGIVQPPAELRDAIRVLIRKAFELDDESVAEQWARAWLQHFSDEPNPLLHLKINPDKSPIPASLLSHSIIRGNLQIVELLLDAKADPNMKSHMEEFYPIELAVQIRVRHPTHARQNQTHSRTHRTRLVPSAQGEDDAITDALVQAGANIASARSPFTDWPYPVELASSIFGIHHIFSHLKHNCVDTPPELLDIAHADVCKALATGNEPVVSWLEAGWRPAVTSTRSSPSATSPTFARPRSRASLRRR